MGVCNCSMFCCALLYVNSSIASILMGKRELIALLNLSSWCLVMVERLFLAVPLGCLQFVIVVFPDHTHLLFFIVTIYFIQICLQHTWVEGGMNIGRFKVKILLVILNQTCKCFKGKNIFHSDVFYSMG